MKNKLEVKSIENWGLFETKRPIIISGPCSAETEEQVLNTAKALSEYNVNVFRAGIWKPRTRPGNFEGVGGIGLEWLKTVKSETGMLISTEVANVKHVYQALKAGIDILWIGARTSSSPFAVQEIADALNGVDIPVLVKNPVNPDIELWYGAIERFYNVGIKKIAALHRGFSGLSKSKYRNEPYWQIPIDLRRKIKNISVICDPSHISGRRDLIQKVSQKAMDLNYSGLMIESHINPNIALSDAKQQVTPDDLGKIINELVVRDKLTQNEDFTENIEELRVKIDECDDMLFNVLSDRMKVAEEIGKVKKKNNITVLQSKRWECILESAIERGSESGLSKVFITSLYGAIHQESINLQTEILNNDKIST